MSERQEAPETIRRLREEHGNTAKLLEALESELAIFDEAGAPDYEVVAAIVDYFQSYPDTCHHPKEDLVFQRLKERDAAAADAVGDLPTEHAELRELTDKLAKAVEAVLQEAEMPRSAFDQVARNFIEHLRAHMEMEERLFFPAALRALAPEDWSEIDARITSPSDPLFGKEVEERFEALRRQILEWERADARAR